MARAPSVLDYDDFRRYLRDFYAFEKRRRSSFSYGVFARRAGIAWRSHLQQVAFGKRNLPASAVPGYLRALRLSGEEAELFRMLVEAGQSATEAERQAAAGRVLRWRRERERRALSPAELREYLSRWPRNLVLSLSLVEGFRPDPRWISRRLGGRISPAEAREALGFLQRRGYLSLKGKRLGSTLAGRLYCRSQEGAEEAFRLLRRNVHREAMDPAVLAGEGTFISAKVVLTAGEMRALGERFRQWLSDSLPLQRGTRRRGELCTVVWDLYPLTKSARR